MEHKNLGLSSKEWIFFFLLDYKDACGVGLNSMKELAYNATALTWSTDDQPVKVGSRRRLEPLGHL